MLVVIFVAALSLFIIFSRHGIVRVYKLKAERTKLSKQIISLRKRNKKISRNIYELKHNKQYIAELARKKLDLIKKGEIVFKFINNKKQSAATAAKTK